MAKIGFFGQYIDYKNTCLVNKVMDKDTKKG